MARAEVSGDIQGTNRDSNQSTEIILSPSPRNSISPAAIWSTFPYEENEIDACEAFHDLAPLSFSRFHHAADLLRQTEKETEVCDNLFHKTIS